MVAVDNEILVPTCEVVLVHPEAVAAARSAALDDDTLQQVSSFFAAFSDPTRLRILVALRARELCVCDLASALDMTSSAVSHQLRLLRLARLVASRRQGKIVYYRLNDGHVSQMLDSGLEHVGEESRMLGQEVKRG